MPVFPCPHPPVLQVGVVLKGLLGVLNAIDGPFQRDLHYNLWFGVGFLFPLPLFFVGNGLV